jgi:hypothetical protein
MCALYVQCFFAHGGYGSITGKFGVNFQQQSTLLTGLAVALTALSLTACGSQWTLTNVTNKSTLS